MLGRPLRAAEGLKHKSYYSISTQYLLHLSIVKVLSQEQADDRYRAALVSSASLVLVFHVEMLCKSQGHILN